MEQVLVFGVKAVPDRVLVDLSTELARLGFRPRAVSSYDLAASRGLDRVYLAAASHPRGIAVRLKGKSLIPGRSSRVFDEAAQALIARLGAPTARTEFPQEIVP